MNNLSSCVYICMHSWACTHTHTHIHSHRWYLPKQLCNLLFQLTICWDHLSLSINVHQQRHFRHLPIIPLWMGHDSCNQSHVLSYFRQNSWKVLMQQISGRHAYGRAPLRVEFVWLVCSSQKPISPSTALFIPLCCQSTVSVGWWFNSGVTFVGTRRNWWSPQRFQLPTSSVWDLKGLLCGHQPFWRNQGDRLATFCFLTHQHLRTSALMEGRSLSCTWPCWFRHVLKAIIIGDTEWQSGASLSLWRTSLE